MPDPNATLPTDRSGGSLNHAGMTFLRCLLVLLIAVPIAEAQTMRTPKAQCEELLNTVLPMAKKLLSTHGTFYPFGASMKSDGTIAQSMAYEGRDDNPPSQPLIDLLRGAFAAQGKTGAIMASAVVYDVRTIPPGETDKTDAIAIELDHRDNYSVVVFVPYAIEAGTVHFRRVFANKGSFRIFGMH